MRASKRLKRIRATLRRLVSPPMRRTNEAKAAEGAPLEPSLGMPAVIMEMLLQSWGGTIRVFPALPEAWRDAAFCRLRTEGAFLVSSRLKGGHVKFVSVESTVGGICRIANPYANPVEVYDSSGELAQSFTGPIVEFPTAPGTVYFQSCPTMWISAPRILICTSRNDRQPSRTDTEPVNVAAPKNCTLPSND